MKNDELDNLLEGFKKVEPSASQFAKWKKASRENGRIKGWARFAAGVAAGTLLGFALSQAVSKGSNADSDAANYSSNISYFYQKQ